jgi:hypothetical protein
VSSPVDAAVAAIAVPQQGAFSFDQLAACGGGPKLAARRCRSGAWTRPLPRVLQLPGFRPTFVQRLWWAILSAGMGAVVSHWSAAALHRLTGFAPVRFTITVPHGRTHTNPVAQVFQTTAPAAPVLLHGLPVTDVARTLIDCGRLVGPIRLGSAVDDADGDGKVTIAQLQRRFLPLAASGRSGITTMHRVLDVRSAEGFVPTRASLERRLDAAVARLPVVFEKEAPLPGREWSNERVDRICHDPVRLLVEGDGRRWHTRVRDFARDARRRRDALAAGYPTVNYTYVELADLDAVEVELLALLGLSRDR